MLRDYEKADLEAMYQLDVLCFERPFRFSRGMMRRFAEARGAVVRLAVLSAAPETVAGFCIGELSRAGSALELYVVTLDVAPGYRRQGVAQALLEAVEGTAREAGANAAALHVHQGNGAAMALYERCGYIVSGLAPAFYGAGLDAWIYRKQLG